MKRPALVWFRDDLRISDHPALRAAARDGAAVALYVLDEESPGIRPLGGAARWWLYHALADLQAELADRGIPLVLRRGAAGNVVPAVVRELQAASLYFNRRYGGPERAVDTRVKSWARDQGLHAESFQGSLLHEPWTVRTGQGGAYRVFTPFWRALSAQDFRPPLEAPAPDGARADSGLPIHSDDLASWRLLPQKPDWAGGLAEAWQPTIEGGHCALEAFLDGALGGYASGRDRPDSAGTSRLSPYLRWGQLSPFEVWHALASVRRDQPTEGASVFAAQLGWREFCWHQLYHHPDLATVNLRPSFDRFPWKWPAGGPGAPDAAPTAGARVDAGTAGDRGPAPGSSEDLFRAWRTGRTGIGFVDAGQRELWTTGSMHNRVRMVSASFLVKNLGIHWRLGEEWFWDTLVDADAASNPANWQWVAGSGADAAPFFRIFNPDTQARRFDPNGDYVRRWVPEFGTPRYPPPVVDLRDSRLEALAGYDSIR